MTHSGRLIAIASGKGGVGKTWLAITLAHALARVGHKTLLFDGDLGLANVDIQLGLMPKRDIGGCLQAGEDPLAAAAAYAPGGFDIAAGRSGAANLAALPRSELNRLADSLVAARSRYDFILADLGAGIEPATRRLAAIADTLLVVTTDEPTALTDAYAVLKLHALDLAGPNRHVPDSRVGRGAPDRRVVVNLAATHAAGARCHGQLARACDNFLHFTPAHAATIRRDDRVRDAIRRQTLLLTRSPTTPAAADVTTLATHLATPGVCLPTPFP